MVPLPRGPTARIPHALAALLLPFATASCVQPVGTIRVNIVPTATPGAAFVIVRPAFVRVRPPKVPHSRQAAGFVDGASEYVLLCDAREGDGMRCGIPPEAALDRFSYTPVLPGAPGPSVGAPIGSLGAESDCGRNCSGAPAVGTAATVQPQPQPQPTPEPARGRR